MTFGRVRVKEQRSLWGSCSRDGNLNFNRRLTLAPFEVLDYVVVHELAHRHEMNHSRRFWAHVERHVPDHRVHRRWLRKNGPKTNQAIAERTEDTGWTCGAVMDNIRKGRIKSEIDPVSGNHLIDKGYLESLVELDNYKTLEKRARMILLWIELSVESRALGHKLGINGDNGKQFFAGIRNKNIDFVSNEETTYLVMKNDQEVRGNGQTFPRAQKKDNVIGRHDDKYDQDKKQKKETQRKKL